ncbi:transposase [Bradyrhizobium diazoefficiens]
MIPEAREVHLSRKDRKVLEACCRSPVTLQRDLKRARIVLLAADGRSTRSIAKEVGVQPRIVSLWRHRYADHGLEGLQDKPRPGKQPIYTKTTDKRILKLLDKPPPQGFARWTGPLLAEALGDVDVQYVWRFLRSHKIDLVARKSWCESNDPNFTAKAADVVGLYVAPPAKAIVLCVDEKPSIQALERAQGYLKLPNGRALTGQSHDYKRHGTTTLFAALEVATGKIIATHSKRRRRVEFLDFMNSVTAAFPNRKLHVILDNLNTHKKERGLAQGPPQRAISFHADKCVMAQSGRSMVFHLAGAVAQRHLLHEPQAASGTHRCLRQRIQRQSRALRLDQEKGPSTPFQRPPYHSALIPGTRRHSGAMRWDRASAARSIEPGISRFSGVQLHTIVRAARAPE